MSLLRRLLKEFWLPALVAGAWTGYSIYTAPTIWGFTTIVNVFGPSFFLASWATGQFFRVRKQAQVESNLLSIEGRLENVVSKLEQQAKDFAGPTSPRFQ